MGPMRLVFCHFRVGDDNLWKMRVGRYPIYMYCYKQNIFTNWFPQKLFKWNKTWDEWKKIHWKIIFLEQTTFFAIRILFLGRAAFAFDISVFALLPIYSIFSVSFHFSHTFHAMSVHVFCGFIFVIYVPSFNRIFTTVAFRMNCTLFYRQLLCTWIICSGCRTYIWYSETYGISVYPI